MYKLATLLIFLTISTTAASSSKISGIWKHSKKPAWIEIQFNNETGIAKIVKHNQTPKAVGLNILTKITKSTTSNIWNAKIYSAKEDQFISVVLHLEKDSLLVFNGFRTPQNLVLKLIKESKSTK